jgi:hypothetical protein
MKNYNLSIFSDFPKLFFISLIIMLPFTPINSRDSKPTIRGFENSQFPNQSNDFPVFDPKLFSLGAESSSQSDNLKEYKNIDRGFMSQRNYEQETNERLNGFSILPRDTRHDNTKKTVEQNIIPLTNRTTGVPFHKI